MFVLFCLLAFSSAGYHDTTCQKLKCSRSEMEYVNHAKMLALGNHTCTSTYIKFYPNGTQQYAIDFPAIVNTRYEPSTGSVHSDYVTGTDNSSINEYCDGNGNVCIEIDGAPNSGYYTESRDQNKEGLGTAYRSIGYYTLDAKKKIKGVQWLIPTSFGDILQITFLDENDKLDYSVVQTCFKI